MPKLTDTQLIVLSNASQRDDGSALPLPKSTKLQGGALQQVLKHLLKHGLLDEQPAAPTVAAWRESDGQRFMLVITDAARAALGVEMDADLKKRSGAVKASADKPKTRRKKRAGGPKARKALRPTVRTGTKQSLLIDLLRRRDGATIAQAVKATGWQPHSVRGAISRVLRKRLRLTVVSDKIDRRSRIYRIP